MSHDYVSTACQHDAHLHCRRSCEWCAVRCRCACHSDVQRMSRADAVEALRSAMHFADTDPTTGYLGEVVERLAVAGVVIERADAKRDDE